MQLIETACDIQQNEDSSIYRVNSLQQLNQQIQIQSPIFYLFKVKQSVIDAVQWQSQKKAQYTGHISACLMRVEENQEQPFQSHGDLSVSKVSATQPKQFQTWKEIQHKEIITTYNDQRRQNAGSKEFYVIVHPDALTINPQQFQQNVQQMRQNNTPYDLKTSACSQAVLEAFGIDTNTQEYQEGISTQKALVKILIKVTRQEYQENIKGFIDMSMSAYFKDARELGNALQQLQSQEEEKENETTFTSN